MSCKTHKAPHRGDIALKYFFRKNRLRVFFEVLIEAVSRVKIFSAVGLVSSVFDGPRAF